MESWMGAIARCPEGNCAQDPPKDSPSCLNRSDSSSHTKVLAMIGGYWNLITWVFSCEIARLLWGYWLTCISQWPMDGIATFSLRAVHLLEVWKHFPFFDTEDWGCHAWLKHAAGFIKNHWLENHHPMEFYHVLQLVKSSYGLWMDRNGRSVLFWLRTCSPSTIHLMIVSDCFQTKTAQRIIARPRYRISSTLSGRFWKT